MTPADLHRIKAGRSNEWLAKVIGVTRSAVCRWEAGQRPIPLYAERFLEMIERGELPERYL